MAKASIKFDKKKGIYEIESDGNGYLRATGIHRWE